MPREFAGTKRDYLEAGERLGISLDIDSSFEDFLEQYVKGTKGSIDITKGIIEFNLEDMYNQIMDEDGYVGFREDERIDEEEIIEDKQIDTYAIYEDMFRRLKQAPRGGEKDDKIRNFILEKTDGNYTYRKGHERIIKNDKIWVPGKVVFRPKYRKVKGKRKVINTRIQEVEDIIKLLDLSKKKASRLKKDTVEE